MAKNYDKLLTELGLSMTVKFIPYSKSRSFKKDARINEKNLNWEVTLLYNGREVITTDYSAGIGHAPSYKNFNPKIHGTRYSMVHATFLEHELEKGFTCRSERLYEQKGAPIVPELASVVYSLIMDSMALDYPTYEEFAPEFGLDSDSIKGLEIYRACIAIGLKMRRIPDDVLKKITTILEDY